MAKILVLRKSYVRRPHRRSAFTRMSKGKRQQIKSTNVKRTIMPPTQFAIKDKGAKGRGIKLFDLKEGTLGVSFSDSARKRRLQEIALARQIGEKKVVGKLRAIQVLNKRTNPTVSKKAKADAHFIAGSFKDKKKVRFPKGFGRNK